MNTDSIVLVTGATGQQGGSVVEALTTSGHTVRAMTRNPGSERALALRNRGVELVTGDFDDAESLKSALRGVDAAFLMSTPFEAGEEAEVAQGTAFVQAAADVNLPYLVYTSVGDADRATGVPHFESKFIVEQRIAELGVPHAVIAPAFFFDNMLAPFVLPGLQNGVLAQALPATTVLKGISVRNIGEFAALVVSSPERFQGTRTNIAGDALTGTEYAEAIGQASGRRIGYSEVPIDQVRQSSDDMARMYEWFAESGYSADIDRLRADYPQIAWERFGDWAARQDWSVLNGE